LKKIKSLPVRKGKFNVYDLLYFLGNHIATVKASDGTIVEKFIFIATYFIDN